MAKRLLGLCPIVMWEAEFISSELGYLAERIYKKIIEGSD